MSLAIEEVWFLLAKASSTLSRKENARFINEIGITLSQARMLLKFGDNSVYHTAYSTLSGEWCPSSITRLVSRLVVLGLVASHLNAKDTRLVQLSLTPRGREVLWRARTLRSVVDNELLTVFTPDEKEKLTTLLLRALESIRSGSQPNLT
ncbi:MarR family winged helix-turn-helix transcriptional regulator [Caballeronia sp. DA-9]|uniref:MarR family winged helix-turn-helix transcriptional regulator n=1 Tax=Caballeronia sp. DA-9 TaxID=3436237 RepID=UPI003F67229D